MPMCFMSYQKTNRVIFQNVFASFLFYVYKKRIFSNFKDYNYVVGQSNKRIARFHIPRGYQYAENKNGEIIS